MAAQRNLSARRRALGSRALRIVGSAICASLIGGFLPAPALADTTDAGGDLVLEATIAHKPVPVVFLGELVMPELDGDDEEPQTPDVVSHAYLSEGLWLPDPLSLGGVVADANMFRAMGFWSAPPPRLVPTGDARYVLPVPEAHITAAKLAAPHHDYPAWDIGVPTGTEVYSVTAGYVTKATAGGRCGTGVEVAGYDGFTYLYCHGSGLMTMPGRRVKAGDLIMLSGDTGRSTAPHLHLQIKNGSGGLLCPQALLQSWYARGGMSPAQAASSGCWYETEDEGEKKSKSVGRKHDTSPDPVSSTSPSPGKSPSQKPSPTASPSPKPSPEPSPSASPDPPAVEPETNLGTDD